MNPFAMDQQNIVAGNESMQQQPQQTSENMFSGILGDTQKNAFLGTLGSGESQKSVVTQESIPQGVMNINPPSSLNPSATQQQLFNNSFGQHSTNPIDVEEKPQYNIIDFFWFINKKIIFNQPLEDNEGHVLVIGFNANFNNLRFGLLKAKVSNAFQKNYIVHSDFNRITGFNIYSEDAIALLHNKGQNIGFLLRERLFKMSNWIPNTTQITWSEQVIKILTKDQTGLIHNFSLYQEQIIGFEKSLNFMLDQSWVLSMYNSFFKNIK